MQTAAGISTISPHDPQAAKPIGQHTQEYPGSCPVRCISSGDHDQQHQTERIHQDVPFAPRDVFRCIIASDAALLTCLHRLAVEDGTARFRMSACCLPDRSANTVVNFLPCPVATPCPEIVINSPPRRQIMR